MRPQRFLPNFDTTCILLLPALIAFRVLITPVAPHDFWWHMAEGRTIAWQHAIPRYDTFSWTQPGQPYYDQSWLSQLLMYGLHSLGGLPLIIFFQAFSVAASYALLLWFALRYIGKPRIAALLLVAVMLVSFDNWMVRPQTYVLPVFMGFFVVLNGYRLGWWQRVWPLPLLMALWANLHGSFPLGLVLIGLTLLGEGYKIRRHRSNSAEPGLSDLQWRRLALCGVLCAAATLLNPGGFHLYEYVQMMFASPSNHFSGEWLSPSIHSFNDSLFFLFATGVLFLLIRTRCDLDVTESLTLLAFTILAFTSGRYIMWFAIVSTAPVSRALRGLARSSQNQPPQQGNIFNLAIVAMIWGMLLPVLPWFKASLGLPPPLGSLVAPETPVQAVAALNKLSPAQRPRRLFHNEASGSYLIWAAPQQKVFIDTRFEFYPPQQWQDTLKLRDGRQLDSMIEKYHFDGMLLERRQHKVLLHYLQPIMGWHQVYSDKTFALFLLDKPMTSTRGR